MATCCHSEKYGENKMSYRPLKEPTEENKKKGIWKPNEIWRTLTTKINDALDYLFNLASSNENKVKKSITTDTDGKAQLVNDLEDNELLPNLVYGTDENCQRGWRPAYFNYYYEKHIVTAEEASSGIVKLNNGTYIKGDNSLMVFLNGLLQCVGEDYIETDETTITFYSGVLTEGDIIIFRWRK